MPGNRRSTRLKCYDYSQEGVYFVTVCTKNHKCIFGNVRGGKMVLNEFGQTVEFTWLDLTYHNKNIEIELDEYVVMPNHVHGIIKIVGAGSKPAIIKIVGAGSKPALDYDHIRAGLEPAPTDHGLSEIIRQFKTFSARRINKINNTPGVHCWQRNFYDHVIRTERDLDRIREYILNNPAGWENDEYFTPPFKT